jgi:hypothetical protein
MEYEWQLLTIAKEMHRDRMREAEKQHVLTEIGARTQAELNISLALLFSMFAIVAVLGKVN